jgi:hypothetical protein
MHTDLGFRPLLDDNSGTAVRKHLPTVLLVEDYEDTLFAMDKLLTRAGYFVLTAGSGHDASRLDTGHNSTARLAGIAWPLGSAIGNRPRGVQEHAGNVSLHNQAVVCRP